MNWCDQRLGLDPGAEMTQEAFAQAQETIAALPLADLVRGWREAALVGRRAETRGTRAFSLYFDCVGHDDPQRALSFIEAEIVSEPDDAIVALLADEKLLSQLLHFNAPAVVAGLEAAAARVPRLRWLLGAVTWSFRGGMVEDKTIAPRLLAIADQAAYDAWEKRFKAGHEEIDFAALPVAELGRQWVELTAYSPLERMRDDNASTLFDYQCDLAREQPERALALAVEIARIEDDPNLLGLLAAGMVEDVLVGQGMKVIDAVEAEASKNLRFRQVLGGVWLSGADPEVCERVGKAIGQIAS